MTQATLDTSPLVFHKIHFSLKKRVKYGQGVFVCGNIPELGYWNPARAHRLKWNEGDIWSCSILLHPQSPLHIEYKYIIAHWGEPSEQAALWEEGSHNRELDLEGLKTTAFCDDVWNMDRITLNLIVAKNKKAIEEEYYVVGDLIELGNGSERKRMKKINRLSSSKDLLDAIKLTASADADYYTYTFYTFRGKEKFHYYYLKKSILFQSQRKPGRLFNFNNQNSPHPNRSGVSHPRGGISILDQCSINQLMFSQINPQILVGSYPRSSADLQKLISHKVTAIFSIQSQKDYRKHGLTPHFLSLLCQQNGLRYQRYSILDMNNDDFINKAEGGLKIMRDMIKSGERLYVHCTAGIYRSPQMIALYLTIFDKFSLEDAVSFIRRRHPYAKPNCKVVKNTINLMDLRRSAKNLYL